MTWHPGGPSSDDGPPTGAESTVGDEETYRSRMWGAAARRRVPLATILTTVVVAVVVLDLNALAILLFWVLRTIILYSVMALFLALALSPAVHLVRRARVSRGVSIGVVFVAAVLIFGGVVVLFTAPLVDAVTHFAKELPSLVRQAEHGRGRIGHLLVRFHLQNWVRTNAPKIASDIARSLKPAQALSVGAAAVSTVVGVGTVAVLTLFLLIEAPMLRSGILGMLSPPVAARVARVYRETARSVTGYMLGNALTSVIAGTVVALTLFVMGVPYPLLLGLWVALVDLLPLVGGLLAGVPVVIVAAFHSLPALVVTAVVFLVYQQVENHALNPLIMSKTVRLEPLWVLLAVLVGATLGDRIGSSLGAFVGALIGIPAGGGVQIVVREIRRGPAPGPGAPGGPVPGPGAPGGPAPGPAARRGRA